MVRKIPAHPVGHRLRVARYDLGFVIVVVTFMLCKLRENRIDKVDHDRRAAIALDQFLLANAFDLIANGFKNFGDAASPSIDGLFAIPNAEERLVFRRPLDDRFGKGFDDVPLHGRSILKLVEQQMIHGAIKSVGNVLHAFVVD